MDTWCIRIKKIADTKISGYVWTRPKINSTCSECPESKMLRPSNEDLRWRAVWMKEFFGYGVDEVAVRAGLC